jgi:hypothetical protein
MYTQYPTLHVCLYLKSSEEQYSEACRNERDRNAEAMSVLINALPEQQIDRIERGNSRMTQSHPSLMAARNLGGQAPGGRSTAT